MAAGSLIEFALQAISSFGVGRISSLYMYPMTFQEFLWASGEDALFAELEKASPGNPIDPVFHRKLLDCMRIHQMIGGLPAVVLCYAQERDMMKCQLLLDDILRTIRDDFAKYAARTPVTKLRPCFFVRRMTGSAEARKQFATAKPFYLFCYVPASPGRLSGPAGI